jgi:hypothetical protein
MARDHPYLRATDFGPDAIGGLFDTSRITLFLDGLDEMPETFRRKAIERLTTETAGLRLTLTSRPDQLRATIQTGQRLPNTAVVELDPVDPRAAARYLLQDQIEPARSAWQQVADHLRAEPESVLARTLRTPLTLSLARMLYSGGDPAQLLRHGLESEQTLRGHLLDQVLVTAYPNPQQRAHVTYWLGWLSHRMNAQPNGAIRDLCWWQVPSWITRSQFRLAAVVTVGLASGLIWLPLGRSRALTALVILGVVGLYFGRQASSVAPQSMTIRWPTRQALRAAAATVLAYMVIIGVPAALIAGGISRVEASTRGGATEVVIVDTLQGLFVGLFIGLGLGLMSAISNPIVVLWRIPLVAALDVTPRLAYRKDWRSQTVGAVIIGLGGALIACPWLWFAQAHLGTIGASVGGLGGWLAFGLTISSEAALLSVFWEGAASSLLLTEIALFLKGRRVRFMPLLETALDRQVLRQAGAVYQFRHADLQDRLAKRYQEEHILSWISTLSS